MKATRLVHQLAGHPAPEGAVNQQITHETAVCCMCGIVEDDTAPADKALGANFTDRTLIANPDSPRVCRACIAICSGKPPRTFRLWTVVATPGRHLPPSQDKAATWIGQHEGLCLTSRADTTPVIDTLNAPPDTPWVVSVAVSGQKHVLPYADINHGQTGTVRMEATSIPYDTPTWRRAFTTVLALRRLGIPADDIRTGTPRYIKTLDQLTQWASLDETIRDLHETPILDLALWTITKGIINDHTYQ